MAFEIPEHYSLSFTTNTEMLLQDMKHNLEGTYQMQSYTGESAQVVKQFGEVEFGEKTARLEDTTFAEIEHKQRWVQPTDYDLALPVEKEDEIRMLNSPLSDYVKAMAAGWNRKKDNVLAAALLGTAYTGAKGVTATAFDSNNTIAVDYVASGAAANSGMTVDKLIYAREQLKSNNVDLEMETPIVGVSPRQISDLLRSTEIGSFDYNNVKALVAGEVDTFAGFRFVQFNRWSVDGSSYRRCPVWVPSALHMGVWNGLETSIDKRPDKKNLTQVMMKGTMGATRTQEGKVYEILCEEA